MKSIKLLWGVICLGFIITSSGCGGGNKVELLDGVYIQDGAGDLDTGAYAAPVVYDWNGDGKKDLLVGQNNDSNGYISFFKNTGTDSSPSFNGSVLIQACNAVCSPLNVTAGG
jgi:hypothetical protein